MESIHHRGWIAAIAAALAVQHDTNVPYSKKSMMYSIFVLVN